MLEKAHFFTVGHVEQVNLVRAGKTRLDSVLLARRTGSVTALLLCERYQGVFKHSRQVVRYRRG